MARENGKYELNFITELKTHEFYLIGEHGLADFNTPLNTSNDEVGLLLHGSEFVQLPDGTLWQSVKGMKVIPKDGKGPVRRTYQYFTNEEKDSEKEKRKEILKILQEQMSS